MITNNGYLDGITSPSACAGTYWQRHSIKYICLDLHGNSQEEMKSHPTAGKMKMFSTFNRVLE
jgi:hypothetical protein